MPGTILVLDGAATNRIMLKVQLSAGYYKVVQSDRLDGAGDIIARCRPDLILAGTNLPDAGLADLCRIRDTDAPGVPLMIVTRENDAAARRSALRCGADDAMSLPLDDVMLLARIRRLIRERHQTEELRPRDTMSRVLGFSEPSLAFDQPARIAVVGATLESAAAQCAHLSTAVRHKLTPVTPDALYLNGPKPLRFDALVLQGDAPGGQPGLRLLSVLRSRSATRHAVVIVLWNSKTQSSAAQVLDLGADDVVPVDCDSEEVALRLKRLLAVQRRSTRMRETLQRGLRAAVRDPLTGLYNRRIALPHLARCARQSRQTSRPFAVMLADIDHFKTVNDCHGHQAGDVVLAETANRLNACLQPQDLLARVGGEEFLIVSENAGIDQAQRLAQTLREKVNGTPFAVCGQPDPVSVTISIGVVVVPTLGGPEPDTEDGEVRAFIEMADRALYRAKDRGRNRVSLITAAA